ncbi:hypothetical protein B6I61_15930 [Klebsiella pneumoniae]|uniref:helix-turn-helix domain-containing protein n=1 Tax=Klebsiella pneumoniae complex TaxID=3390273 RepID=UPI000C7B1936|nr:helix-turn-helix transcriptional regulator [Klebsiella pneumoniae]ELH4141960.1 helix-turn-helix transcriptional regulator [Klebsiella pneumoniae]MBF7745994.1 helix-turn-helix transcriptional regulator [Klebsiella pneumoniae]MBF7761832.1 helix-turn-helix transcriptional regulator [Klebsiella pneumoniae]MBF7767528.1 helix-turn-helix transcriptional regulator [Klebsiella pneumoniae]MBF7815109.1 helix-turn-helix transcriptional regulator [Klebsiella pneumoniae]
MTTDNYDFDDDFEFPFISERELCCARLVFNTTEDILLAMQDQGVTQSTLAKKLGKSKSYVSQLLDGTRNMTLKTLADISYALSVNVKVVISKDGKDVSHPIVPECTYDRYVSTSNDINLNDAKIIKITISSNDIGCEDHGFTGTEINRSICY